MKYFLFRSSAIGKRAMEVANTARKVKKTHPSKLIRVLQIGRAPELLCTEPMEDPPSCGTTGTGEEGEYDTHPWYILLQSICVVIGEMCAAAAASASGGYWEGCVPTLMMYARFIHYYAMRCCIDTKQRPDSAEHQWRSKLVIRYIQNRARDEPRLHSLPSPDESIKADALLIAGYAHKMMRDFSVGCLRPIPRQTCRIRNQHPFFSAVGDEYYGEGTADAAEIGHPYLSTIEQRAILIMRVLWAQPPDSPAARAQLNKNIVELTNRIRPVSSESKRRQIQAQPPLFPIRTYQHVMVCYANWYYADAIEGERDTREVTWLLRASKIAHTTNPAPDIDVTAQSPNIAKILARTHRKIEQKITDFI